MLGPLLYIIGALAFFSVQPSSALNAKEANSVCALLQDGIKIFSQIECNQFYSCKNGTATLNTCLSGYYFSKEDQACVPPTDVACGSTEANPCDNIPDGYFVAVANSCSGFYYCQKGVGTKSSCTDGLNFNQNHQACEYQSEYPCSEGGEDTEEGVINLCSVIPTGIYFGSASSCKTWQKCQSSGPPQVSDCPEPYVFNVDTLACDYKENASCRQLKGDPETGGSSLEGTPCSENGEYKSDGATCDGYYVCSSNKYTYGKCINGLYFNPEDKHCVNRLDAINDCDRCRGTKLEFVNRFQDDCKGYAYCKNGKTQSTGVCSADGYYDEVAGGCVSGKSPDYPVCKSESTTEPEEPEEPVPGTDEKNPATDDKNPTTDEKNPTTDEKNPTTDEKNPTTDEKNPTTDEKNPATDEKNPATDEKNPATDEKNPVTDEKNPATDEKNPNTETDQETDEKNPDTETDQETDEKNPDTETDQETEEKNPDTETDQETDEKNPDTETDQETEEKNPDTETDQETDEKNPDTETDQETDEKNPDTETDQETDEKNPDTETDQETDQKNPDTETDQETDEKNPDTETDQETDEKNPDTETDQETDEKNPDTKTDQETDEKNPDTETDQETDEKNPDTETDQETDEKNPDTETDQETDEKNPDTKPSEE